MRKTKGYFQLLRKIKYVFNRKKTLASIVGVKLAMEPELAECFKIPDKILQILKVQHIAINLNLIFLPYFIAKFVYDTYFEHNIERRYTTCADIVFAFRRQTFIMCMFSYQDFKTRFNCRN